MASTSPLYFYISIVYSLICIYCEMKTNKLDLGSLFSFFCNYMHKVPIWQTFTLPVLSLFHVGYLPEPWACPWFEAEADLRLIWSSFSPTLPFRAFIGTPWASSVQREQASATTPTDKMIPFIILREIIQFSTDIYQQQVADYLWNPVLFCF